MMREKESPDNIKPKSTSDLCEHSTDHDPCDKITKLQDGNLERTDAQ